MYSLSQLRQVSLTMTTQANIRFLRQKEVTHLTGIPRATLYLLMSKGLFPKQISIGSGHCVAWLESEVLGFMQERIAAREGK
ncbi:MAG: AlpA family transcriptional regulator [Pseudomonadales bacterium]|nr:AlpA family transcriptional regulator [Pseudomonadales bacterium]